MLRKPFHGWRINQEIQKLRALCTASPGLNTPGSATRPTPLTSHSPLTPLSFYCQNFPPTSHFHFTHQITKFPLSTSSLMTVPSAAAYHSRAPKPEDLNLNVESLRESSDDRRENDADGKGCGRRRMLPEERVLIFTCMSKDGKCRVYCFWTKHNSEELSREEYMVITYLERDVAALKVCPCDLGTIERLKQKSKVVNKLVVYPGDMYHVAMEEIMKYGGKVMPLSEQVANKREVYLRRGFHVACGEAMKYFFLVKEAMKHGVGVMMRHFPLQVANKLEVYLGRGFRVAYEEAMKYGVQIMMHHFALRVALCDKMPLERKIALIEASLLGGKMCDLPWNKGVVPSRCSRLWCLSVLQLLDWIQSGRKRKKWIEICSAQGIFSRLRCY